eukprot:7850627-Ditylum_brightwellii.AAC.2
MQLQQLFIKYGNHLGEQFTKSLVMAVLEGKSAMFARNCTVKYGIATDKQDKPHNCVNYKAVEMNSF